jgi:hypothetical protein
MPRADIDANGMEGMQGVIPAPGISPQRERPRPATGAS